MIKRAICLCFVSIIMLSSAAYARIDILPRKIVMEQRDRSAELTILNLYDEPSLYRLSVLHYRQNSDGTYTILEMPLSDAFDPATGVRISPKQFTVAASGRQKIRVSLRKPKNLPEGEYRFHLLASRYPLEKAADDRDGSKGSSVAVKVNLAVAIPVVIRHGRLDVAAEIGETIVIPAENTDNGRPKMYVTVNRSGSSSSIGDLKILSSNAAGVEKQIGYISNMNIFAELGTRTVKVPLAEDPTGRNVVRIVYSDDDGNIFDEKTIRP